jgi:type VI secretion system protein ImpK
MRPRPGAGRRTVVGGTGTLQAPTSGSASTQGPLIPAIGPTKQRQHYEPPMPQLSVPAIDQLESLGLGLSPLVRAATPLLILAHRLRFTLSLHDVEALRGQALEDLRRFEDRARAAGIPNETTIAARYVLCAALDESVLATPWGAQSGWGENTLLVVLHREAWGGEKFFEMLQRLSADPNRHIELMELQYYCMAFGFSGKYQLLDRGHVRLAEVQTTTYRQIRELRGVPPPELSRHWRGVSDRRNPLIRYVPWWIVAATALALVAITFVLCNALLDRYAAPVQETLAKSGLEGFTEVSATPITAPAAGPTLTTLLVEDINAGTVSVEEQGGRTLMTLVAPTLFASGSAIVDPSYLDTLKHIADALDQIPGRILVVGHTDDQPVKSLHYRDNFELSRERAISVAKLLRVALRDPARVQWTGVGSSQPRYKPESAPENRARNRRVEIIHVPEAPAGTPVTTGER